MRTRLHVNPPILDDFTVGLWKIYFALSILAAPNGPALDAQGELDVQTGLVVRGAYV